MKKTFIIVLLLVICLICCSCNSSNGETNISDSKSDSLTSDIVDNLNSSNDTSTEQSIVISTETPCEHSYGEWKTVTEPTCEFEGKSERVCENCNEKEEKIVDKTEHTWEDATCITAKICSVCKITEGQPISHNWSVATCVNPKTCTMCKATEGTVADHKWQSATCVEAKKCVTCGKTEGEANGHTWKDATCTTAKTCTTCKETTGTALGHEYRSGICTVCNVKDPNYQDPSCYSGTSIKTITNVTGAECTSSKKNVYYYDFEYKKYTSSASIEYGKYFAPYIEYLDSLGLEQLDRPAFDFGSLGDSEYVYKVSDELKMGVSWTNGIYTDSSWITIRFYSFQFNDKFICIH